MVRWSLWITLWILLGTRLGLDADVATTTAVADDIETCEWNVTAVDGTLVATWSGNVGGSVVVSAVMTSSGKKNGGGCSYENVSKRVEFLPGSTDLPTCPNERYRVGVNFANCSADRESVDVWTPPGPPANVSLTSVGNTSFGVSWERPTGSGDVVLYAIRVTDANGHLKVTSTSEREEATVPGLAPRTLYGVRVAAKNDAFWGQSSALMMVETDIGVPHAPKTLRVTSLGNTSVSLSWEEPAPSTGPIVSYLVHWSNSSGSGEEDTGSNHTVHQVERLTPYVNYTFKVLATTEAGPGEWSEELDIRTKVGVPPPPGDLKETFVGNTSVGLKWTEPAPSAGPVVSYRVRWNGSSEVGEENAESEFIGLNGLTPHVYYAFRVLAFTEAGPGDWSKEMILQTKPGAPHPPGKPKATSLGNTTVVLEWKEPAPSTGPVVSYRVHWSNSSRSGEEDTGSNHTVHQVERLTPYVNYTFKVLAETEAGPGEWSEELDVRTKVGVPHAPANLTATDLANTSVSLKWEEPKPSTGPILRYLVEWRNFSGNGTLESRDTHCTVAPLTPYLHYAFRVRAVTEAGNGRWSHKLRVRMKAGVPHAPIALTTSRVDNTSVDLSWKAPNVSTGPLLGYRIQWWSSINNVGGAREEVDTPPDATTHRLERLAPFADYEIRVVAVTEAGPGQWSEGVKVKTKVGVPHAPRNLTAAHVDSDSVDLRWTEPAVSTGPIRGYRIEWRNSSGSAEVDTPTDRTAHRLGGLMSHVRYVFKVLALTEAGPGAWSEEIGVVTEVGVPSAPRNLHLEQATSTSVVLRWDSPEFPNGPLLVYWVTWNSGSEASTGSFPAEKKSVRHELSDLLPHTTYHIRVFAATSAGRGPGSDELEAGTKVGVPLPAVILDVKPSSNRTATVRWKTVGVYPGPVDFSLQAWKYPAPCSDRTADGVDKELKGMIPADEWGREHVTEVRDLAPFGNYSFLVVLKTEETEGVGSKKSGSIRMPPEAPSEPQDVRAECVDPTTLRLKWKPPSSPNGIIEQYIIAYGMEDNEMNTVSVRVKDMCEGQSHVLGGLRPERRYRISVRAGVKGVEVDGAPGRPKEVCVLPPGIPVLGDEGVRIAATSGTGADELVLEWTRQSFSESMGSIVRYAVLVGRLQSLGNATSGKWAEDGPPWSNFSSGDSDFYQATPLDWNPFLGDTDPLECTVLSEATNATALRCFIGTQKQCPDNQTYCNGPLFPDTPYEMKIRAFTRGGYTETQPFYARSGPAPSPSVAGKVTAVTLVLVILVGLAAGCYVLKRKGHLEHLKRRILSRLMHHETREEHHHQQQEPKRENSGIQMEQHVPSQPVKPRKFADHVLKMMADSHLLFSLEFEALRNSSPKLSCSVAESEDNRLKNRWMNIFPFDHSRVKLLPLCDEPGSDYINANYIPGICSRREYIATQGPLPHTVDDFWRMLWEQSVGVVVMLTQCVERGKKKCERYWPDAGQSQFYGDLQVTHVSESALSSYVIRIFHVQLGSHERYMKQMHFTQWPDFGCPESPGDLLNFVSAVREHMPKNAPGPLLVHCSAGVGRTGTFIAVDRLSRQLRTSPDQDIDIFGTVLELRNYRTNMVQTEDQYIYIHFCVRQLIEDLRRSQKAYSEEIYENMATKKDTPL